MEPNDVAERLTKNPCLEAEDRAFATGKSVMNVLATYSLTDLKLMARQRLSDDMAELVENLVLCFEPATAPKSVLILKLIQVVRVEPRVRSTLDERVWVKRALAEYRGSDGDEYRKAFEQKNGDPVVPELGTHESLAALKYQWRKP